MDSVRKRAGGFITEEIRKKGERIGFQIMTVPEGRTGLLARIGHTSFYRVGRYGVDIAKLEEMACPAILGAKAQNCLIVVDEIGKMELFSRTFRSVLLDVLDSPNRLIGTIMDRPDAFADSIKQRPDVRLLFLDRKNGDDVFQETLDWLDKPSMFCL